MAGLFASEMNATHGTVRAAGDRTIRYVAAGRGKVTLVLLHGGMCDHTYWHNQFDAFSPGFRVLAVDLAGHNGSDPLDAPFGVKDLAEDVVRVVEAEGASNVIVAGHSLGAPVALETAAALGGSALGTVVVDYLHQPNARIPGPPPMDGEAYKAAMRRGMFNAASDPELRERIVAAMTAHPQDEFRPVRDALAAHDPAAGLRAASPLRLSMLLSGMRPVDVAGIRESHPTARITVFKDAGHFVMLENAADFNAVLRSELLVIAGTVSPL